MQQNRRIITIIKRDPSTESAFKNANIFLYSKYYSVKRKLALIIGLSVLCCCYLECKNNHFGVDCKKNCGHCLANDRCNHINGSCLNGCSHGYRGNYCNDSLYIFFVFMWKKLRQLYYNCIFLLKYI